jgi:hypothetical protein
LKMLSHPRSTRSACRIEGNCSGPRCNRSDGGGREGDAHHTQPRSGAG